MRTARFSHALPGSLRLPIVFVVAIALQIEAGLLRRITEAASLVRLHGAPAVNPAALQPRDQFAQVVHVELLRGYVRVGGCVDRVGFHPGALGFGRDDGAVAEAQFSRAEALGLECVVVGFGDAVVVAELLYGLRAGRIHAYLP
ncbi:hypothetical protein PUN4_290008 [Paraburkholderia unamae]|nr:hypothetical protein PUN4_290008 [Paraburkholderia unamae]